MEDDEHAPKSTAPRLAPSPLIPSPVHLHHGCRTPSLPRFALSRAGLNSNLSQLDLHPSHPSLCYEKAALHNAGEPLRTFYGWTGYWEAYLLQDSVDVMFYRCVSLRKFVRRCLGICRATKSSPGVGRVVTASSVSLVSSSLRPTAATRSADTGVGDNLTVAPDVPLNMVSSHVCFSRVML